MQSCDFCIIATICVKMSNLLINNFLNFWNFKWSFIFRVASPIHNRTLLTFVWSRKIKIYLILSLKIEFFLEMNGQKKVYRVTLWTMPVNTCHSINGGSTGHYVFSQTIENNLSSATYIIPQRRRFWNILGGHLVFGESYVIILNILFIPY